MAVVLSALFEEVRLSVVRTCLLSKAIDTIPKNSTDKKPAEKDFINIFLSSGSSGITIFLKSHCRFYVIS